MKKIAARALLALSLFAAPALAFAADHQVQMLNKSDAGVMVFEPSFLNIAVGDTVTFVPTDKSHNVETIRDMFPEGAEAFRSKVNEEYTVTFDVAGAYGIKCTPHFTMGMVMLIVVGEDPTNLASIEEAAAPPKARERLNAQLEAYRATLN